METSRMLFMSIKIGDVDVKNRIVMAPMVTGQASPDGKATDAHIAWYGTRAKGGVGLIISEMTAVAQGGAAAALLGIWDDDAIPKFREVSQKVHEHGARIFMQLSHAGRQTSKAFTGGKTPVAPSAISCPMGEPMTKEVPREVTIDEIEEIIEQFGQAARRSMEAGFDGVEVHGAHGYLIAAFMSAYSNKRHDKFGGDLNGRIQFPQRIIRRIRREVGDGFPIGFRYSGNEFVPDGRTIDESRRIAPKLVAAGVDYLHISAGLYESFWSEIPIHGTREGVYADDAAAIKGAVNVPVIAVGRIKSPEVAEEILELGKADMVALGRQLICDPQWPLKVAAGEFEDIRPCIGCMQSCINRGIIEGKPASCIYNTSAGMEMETEIRPAKTVKNVLIVGGGPGGLEAARVAALRGHHVKLFEKSGKLGGRFNLACIPPFKQEFATAIKWLSHQVNKLNVHMELNKEVTPELVEQISPDAVILATGALPQMPSIPGIESGKVVFGEDILAGKAALGNRVAILGGGGVGAAVADFMGQRGKDVTIIEKLPEIGVCTGIPLLVGITLIPRIKSYGVQFATNARVKEISDDAVIVSIDGKKETIRGFDQIIVATGTRSSNDLTLQLEGKLPQIYVIGDAKEPRTAFEATQEGAEVARRL